MIAIMSSVVATGRMMKGRDGLMDVLSNDHGGAGPSTLLEDGQRRTGLARLCQRCPTSLQDSRRRWTTAESLGRLCPPYDHSTDGHWAPRGRRLPSVAVPGWEAAFPLAAVPAVFPAGSVEPVAAPLPPAPPRAPLPTAPRPSPADPSAPRSATLAPLRSLSAPSTTTRSPGARPS